MSSLWRALWWGLALQFVGVVLAVLCWPSTELSPQIYGGPELEETGSVFGMLAGFAIANIGVILVAIFVIGVGVKLGRQASPTPVPRPPIAARV